MYNGKKEVDRMKAAIVGSRTINADISAYLPSGIDEIITGGAEGIDRCAERYADKMFISKHVIRPDYEKNGQSAPIIRDRRIVELSDIVIAFWDGESPGTAYTVKYARKLGKPVKVWVLKKGTNDTFEA